MDKIDILIGRLASENCSGKKVIPLNMNGLARFKEEIYKLLDIGEIVEIIEKSIYYEENSIEIAQKIIDLLKK